MRPEQPFERALNIDEYLSLAQLERQKKTRRYSGFFVIDAEVD
jgi:hypothetical protein